MRSKKLIWGLIVFVAILLAFAGYRYFQDRQASIYPTAINLEINKPDIIIQSDQLAKLPKDILAVPVLNKILTEDFVFYYEEAASKRSIAGTIKRLAYERDLQLTDKLLQNIMSQAAQFYVWKDAVGKPKYWLMASESSVLTNLAQVIAKIALDDTQLVEAGALNVAGASVALYALKYQGHTGLFAHYNDRLVFLSDAGMLFALEETEDESVYEQNNYDEDMLKAQKAKLAKKPAGVLIKDRAEQVATLLESSDKNRQSIIVKNTLPKAQAKHSIYVSPALISLSYNRLMPSFKGLNFTYEDQQWQSQIALDSKQPSVLNNSELLNIIPQDVAACTTVPVDWSEATHTLATLKSIKDYISPLKAINQPVISCWFADSSTVLPIFITKIPQNIHNEELLFKVFENIIGAKEFENKDRFPVKLAKKDDVSIITRIVSARYGSHLSPELDDGTAKQLSAQRYFPVSLAFAGDYIIFSADVSLVERVLAVYQHKYPALTERLDNNKAPLLWINNQQLAQLIKSQFGLFINANSDMYSVYQQNIEPKLSLLSQEKNWQVYAELEKAQNRYWYPLIWQEVD